MDTMKVDTSEYFLLLLLYSHVVATARELHLLYPTGSAAYLAKYIVASYVRLPQERSPLIPEDRLHIYAIELLSLSLLWHGFCNSINEGDGDQVMVY